MPVGKESPTGDSFSQRRETECPRDSSPAGKEAMAGEESLAGDSFSLHEEKDLRRPILTMHTVRYLCRAVPCVHSSPPNGIRAEQGSGIRLESMETKQVAFGGAWEHYMFPRTCNLTRSAVVEQERSTGRVATAKTCLSTASQRFPGRIQTPPAMARQCVGDRRE
ncbi:hypothetical protein B296_00038441 [Ensete ventricosum]|uniref:Uncharacterized protein n=1 Tax=Ensete ventricosum TaxID=4639 RepID=A0A426ZTG5_ENSVE|nr:hypothetical protein B296_00038441 [Ensete ventricosum]